MIKPDVLEYNPVQAITLAKVHATCAFNENIDIVMQLNLDPKHGDQMLRGSCTLPHAFGKTKKVAVLTEPEHLEKAKKADKIIDK